MQDSNLRQLNQECISKPLEPTFLNPMEKCAMNNKMNLIVRKYSGDDDDHGQDDAEIEVVIRRLLVGSCLKSRKSPTQSFVN